MKRSVPCIVCLLAGLMLTAGMCPTEEGADAGSNGHDSGSSHDGGGGHDSAIPANAKFCQERCTQTADCAANFECQSDNRCHYTGQLADPCANDDDCQIMMSGWTTECTSASGCTNMTCVQFAGSGYCAVQPNQYFTCAQAGMTDVTLDDIDGTSVTVCSNTQYECNTASGTCWNPCTDNSECAPTTLYPHCNTATRLCECQSSPSDSCVGVTSGGTVCRNGSCGCTLDDDCVGTGFTKCYDGVCGCTDVSDCTTNLVHPGTTHVCEVYAG
jgi:hypothetical protein